MTKPSQKRPTLSEATWPGNAEFCVLSRQWAIDATARMMSWVWKGYDELYDSVHGTLIEPRHYEDMERDLTQLLEPRIRDAMPDFLPFDLQHGTYERETRRAAPAQPPAYDLAFIMRANPRVMWPLEAKVLRTDTGVAAYVADVREQFLECRYAPFSAEGAMLGYLLQGRADNAAAAIQSALSTPLERFEPLTPREHYVSKHMRRVPDGKLYPKRFSCHHLILTFHIGTASAGAPALKKPSERGAVATRRKRP